MRGRVRRQSAEHPVADRPRTWSADKSDRRVLGAAVARLPAPTRRCRAAGTTSRRDLERYRTLQADIAAVDDEISVLLAVTDGQILTSLPGVAIVRAAAFAAHSLPISRFPAEHLYSATGLARRSTSRRPYVAAEGSSARAWPSTATR